MACADWAWTQKKGPILAETTTLLDALYAPQNRRLRDMLAAEGTSCSTSGAGADLEGPACDDFLWSNHIP